VSDVTDKHPGILLFGGTFDPIHNGHIQIARFVAAKLSVQKVIFIPSAHPPHKEIHSLTPAPMRLALTQLALADDDLFEVSDCELNRRGPSFTLDTVRYFRTLYDPDTPLYWLIGADTISELPGWYKVDKLLEECTIVTARRPGYHAQLDPALFQTVLTPAQITRLQQHIIYTPQFDISATDIRSRIRRGLPVNELIPPKVLQYITDNNLYKSHT